VSTIFRTTQSFTGADTAVFLFRPGTNIEQKPAKMGQKGARISNFIIDPWKKKAENDETRYNPRFVLSE
jgi:hypothetical protein